MPYNCRYSGMMGSLSGLGSDMQSEHVTRQVLFYFPLVKNYDDVYTCCIMMLFPSFHFHFGRWSVSCTYKLPVILSLRRKISLLNYYYPVLCY